MGIKFIGNIDGIEVMLDSVRAWREITIDEKLHQGTEETLRDLMIEMQEYPPESSANRAPPFPYWVRGVGRVHASGKISPRSQQYNESWSLHVNDVHDGTDGILKNTASYAPWLGSEQTQAWFHRMRGWPTVETKAEEKGISVVGIGTTVSRMGARIREALELLQAILGR